MTVEQIAKSLEAEIISMPAPEREPEGVYCGDLLSWVMGNSEYGNVWVTIMKQKKN